LHCEEVPNPIRNEHYQTIAKRPSGSNFWSGARIIQPSVGGAPFTQTIQGCDLTKEGCVLTIERTATYGGQGGSGQGTLYCSFFKMLDPVPSCKTRTMEACLDCSC
jgi:hypothetical protein